MTLGVTHGAILGSSTSNIVFGVVATIVIVGAILDPAITVWKAFTGRPVRQTLADYLFKVITVAALFVVGWLALGDRNGGLVAVCVCALVASAADSAIVWMIRRRRAPAVAAADGAELSDQRPADA